MQKGSISRRRFLRGTAVAGVSTLIAACSPEVVTKEVEKVVTQEVEKVVTQEVEKVVTATPGPEAEQITLRIWDQWTGGGDVGMELMLARFQNMNPHVTFEREAYSGDELRDTIKTAIGAGTGPDLAYFDMGAFGMVQLVRAQQLLSLDDAYQQYGWDQKIFPLGQKLATVEGVRYAVPHEFEYEPVFYNKAIYAELGLSIPKTHAEFVANCEACVDAGYIGIAAGNAGSPEMRHIWGFPLNNLMGKDKMDDIFLCGGTWEQPEVIDSIRITALDYEPYYPEDSLAIAGQDGNNMYFNGQGGHKLIGTWMVNSILEAGSDFETGMYLYPAFDGGEVLPQSCFGSAYMAPKTCSSPETVFDLIDYFYSEENAKVWVETVNVVPPMAFDATTMDLPDLMKDVMAVFSDPDIEFGWMPPCFVAPNFYDMMRSGLQQIMAGEKTPEQQAADLQKLWEADIEEGAYPIRC